MVIGTDVFRQRFRNFSEQFTIIGGTACSILFAEAELEFRSTRDFDIVLIVEALNESFAREFWDFIAEGGYELHRKALEHRSSIDVALGSYGENPIGVAKIRN